ncbi:hypothetical protein NZD89_07695 [Alicyclobacillus fastidiosus]|uniref:Uncharacterized protein n=1 Tax=Alicyclobacillus fastidiosus TaxID=392011 RepID=A0ABY6ZK14_9BACL|nr:hypothetical protein [Alicyclobacillus fastidiosus]WAH43268.1 hypothetical protein NZD89_07695 [Alicyclobacillus fastidiosus]
MSESRIVIVNVEYGREPILALGQQLVELLVRTQRTRNLSATVANGTDAPTAVDSPR